MNKLTKTIFAVVAVGTFATGQIAQAFSDAEYNQKLALGVNLGNCLEAPNEGELAYGLNLHI